MCRSVARSSYPRRPINGRVSADQIIQLVGAILGAIASGLATYASTGTRKLHRSLKGRGNEPEPPASGRNVNGVVT